AQERDRRDARAPGRGAPGGDAGHAGAGGGPGRRPGAGARRAGGRALLPHGRRHRAGRLMAGPAPDAAPGAGDASARARASLPGLPDWERRPMGRAARERLLLERPAALLARLGDPQARYRTVLVAGTKGKGSTAAMLAGILRAAGHRTGFYSQPHLHTYRARIRVDRVPVAP